MESEIRPDLSDESPDPIGPPVLPSRPRYGARAMALSGLAVGMPLAVGVIGMLCPTPTWPPATY